MLADAVDRDRLVETFLELVAIDSPTGHEENIGRELADRLGRLGCQVTRSFTWSGRVLASVATSFTSGRSRYRSRRPAGALTSSAPI
jgi:hypothetical protein